jgi:hypothetical protein
VPKGIIKQPVNKNKKLNDRYSFVVAFSELKKMHFFRLQAAIRQAAIRKQTPGSKPTKTPKMIKSTDFSENPLSLTHADIAGAGTIYGRSNDDRGHLHAFGSVIVLPVPFSPPIFAALSQLGH